MRLSCIPLLMPINLRTGSKHAADAAQPSPGNTYAAIGSYDDSDDPRLAMGSGLTSRTMSNDSLGGGTSGSIGRASPSPQRPASSMGAGSGFGGFDDDHGKCAVETLSSSM